MANTKRKRRSTAKIGWLTSLHHFVIRHEEAIDKWLVRLAHLGAIGAFVLMLV